MDADSYIYKLGLVDDEVVIKGFVIAEIMETGDRVATDATLCFLYPAFSIEVSCLQASKGSCLKQGLREGQSSGFVTLWLTVFRLIALLRKISAHHFFHKGISEKWQVKRFLFSQLLVKRI